jgi:hypothetical protein
MFQQMFGIFKKFSKLQWEKEKSYSLDQKWGWKFELQTIDISIGIPNFM